MTRLEVPLTDAQLTALQQLAEKRHVSAPELAQEGVAKLIEAAAGDRDAVRRRARAAAGRFHSGCSDLSVRHDDYLAEDVQE
jgi:hypothetical protein